MSNQGLFDYLAGLNTEGKSREMIEKEVYEAYGKRLAVVCIDSTGFSRTVKKQGIVYYLSLIAKMRKILETVVERHNAVSYRSFADNFFAEFSSVEDAFNAVVEASVIIRDAGLFLDEQEPYQICSGIGYGDVLFSKGEGPYGDQMNLASKLGEDTAEGEEILLTPEALQELPEALHSSFEKRKFSISGVSADYYRTTMSDQLPR